ncbi:peptidase inhibitor family I36 protein [Streptomyces sp. NPDC056144]|uniref:peptidase inhibitor family I36 protein n=1 Tax=unclassified Streptomyces TaxID=2593676 RepID=UPI0035E29F90
MNLIKNLFGRLPAVGLAVVMLAAALVWTQAGTARAAYDNCPVDDLCLYTGAGGSGEVVSFSLQDGAVLDYKADAALAGKTFVSFRNNTTSWACLYEGASYGGTKMQSVRPGHLGGDLPQEAGVQEVVPASHKFARSKPGCRTGFERCQTTRVCIFQGPSGRGVAAGTTQPEALPDGALGNRDYSATWDEKVVSVSNRSDKFACFYESPGYGAWHIGTWTLRAYVVPPGHETTLPTLYQQKISSHKLADAESKC